uniref:hypothetical protein n=1 Tax=Nonomuraea sp. CA-252377 TaxID=3240003 RepID=UPI003F4918D5
MKDALRWAVVISLALMGGLHGEGFSWGGAVDDGSDDVVCVRLMQRGRRYELVARPLVDGRLAIEVSGGAADGDPVAVLSGSLPAADLGLLADLVGFLRARCGQEDNGQISVVEQQRLTHADAYRGWSAEQDERLRQLAGRPDASVKGLAAALQRSEGAIRSRLRRLRIDKLPHQAPA